MARGRFISNSIAQSEKFHMLGDDSTRLVYIMLIIFADKEGFVDGNLSILKAKIKPLDEKFTKTKLKNALKKCEFAKLIKFHTVIDDGFEREFIEILNFKLHQKGLDTRKESGSKWLDLLSKKSVPGTDQVQTKYRPFPVLGTDQVQPNINNNININTNPNSNLYCSTIVQHDEQIADTYDLEIRKTRASSESDKKYPLCKLFEELNGIFVRESDKKVEEELRQMPNFDLKKALDGMRNFHEKRKEKDFSFRAYQLMFYKPAILDEINGNKEKLKGRVDYGMHV